jgi:hypothetical protein
MILSPMQQDDINNMSMDELRSFMTEGFEITNDHIDNLEIDMNAKFANVYEKFTEQRSYIDEGFLMTNGHIDNLETNMNEKFEGMNIEFDGMNSKFEKVNEKIDLLSTLVTKIADKIL